MNPLNAKEPARMGFGDRLYEAIGAHGPVCVGIDPHAALLARWGLDDDARGLREFSLRVVEALGGRAAALKPQSAFFERHGSQPNAATSAPPWRATPTPTSLTPRPWRATR